MDAKPARPGERLRQYTLYLYHATRQSKLPSILEHGLLCRHYGDVHGHMDIAPAHPSVYLSKSRDSDNLHTALFDDPHDPVIVLRIDADALMTCRTYPDEAIVEGVLMRQLGFEDADEPDGLKSFARELAQHFALKAPQARRLAEALACAPDEDLLKAAQPLAIPYLKRHGEIAYAQDIPAHAILDWAPHPASARAPMAADDEDPGVAQAQHQHLAMALGHVREHVDPWALRDGQCHTLALALLRHEQGQGRVLAALRHTLDADGLIEQSFYSHMVFEDRWGRFWDIDGDEADTRWEIEREAAGDQEEPGERKVWDWRYVPADLERPQVLAQWLDKHAGPKVDPELLHTIEQSLSSAQQQLSLPISPP